MLYKDNMEPPNEFGQYTIIPRTDGDAGDNGVVYV